MKSIAFLASMTAAITLAGSSYAQTPPPSGDPADTQLSGTALPQPETEDGKAVGPQMTTGILGDWGGLRSRLYEDGLDFQVAYGNELAWNPRGGSHRDVTVIGQAIVGMTADMDKIAGVEGGLAKVALFYRHGPSLTVNADLGMLQQVQEAYGRGEIVRLVEA